MVGSRYYDNYEAVVDTLSRISITLLISGGAMGADALGERYADEFGIEKLIFPADWKKFGKSAGMIRNSDIIKNCDIVIAFWDGKSSGTLDSISKAVRTSRAIKIISPDGTRDFINEKWILAYNNVGSWRPKE